MVLHEWLVFFKAFCFCFGFNIHRSGVLTALAWLVPHETAAVSAQVLCTPYNHAPCHLMQSHIRKVYAYLAVTCHLRFWQNDRGLLRATAVTRGWNGYRNKSRQHRKAALYSLFFPYLVCRVNRLGCKSRNMDAQHVGSYCISRRVRDTDSRFIAECTYLTFLFVFLTPLEKRERERYSPF